MSKDLEVIEHLDEINKVVEEYLKGSDPTKISKDLNLPRTRVVAHLNEWKVMVSVIGLDGNRRDAGGSGNDRLVDRPDDAGSARFGHRNPVFAGAMSGRMRGLRNLRACIRPVEDASQHANPMRNSHSPLHQTLQQTSLLVISSAIDTPNRSKTLIPRTPKP